MDYITLLPFWYIAVCAFGFGVIIGSFLNVVIYRFNTGKSLAGSSHCLSCQKPLRWFDLFPLISYICLRGRCRNCGARIPSRYWWVELGTGLLFVLVIATVSPIWWLMALTLVAILMVVAVYDIYHMIIPQLFVWLIWFLAITFIVVSSFLVFDWWWISDHLLASLLAYAFFATLWKVSDGRWIGYGDAKLAAPLAVLVGLLGTFSMVVLSFWIGTIISLTMMLYMSLLKRRGQQHLRFINVPLTMKSEVPFAPFLILGFLMVYLGHIDVLLLISYVLPF